jgi:hypothetical protein
LSTDAPRSVYRYGSRTRVEVHSVRLARRITPQGKAVTDLIVEIIQRRRGYFDAGRQERVDKNASEPREGDFTFYGGCTLLIDPSDHKVRYAITKHVLSDSRLKLEREFRDGRTSSTSLRATYFGDPDRESPQVTQRELPPSKDLAGVDMRLTAGSFRELHWHNSATPRIASSRAFAPNTPRTTSPNRTCAAT